ncbi:unannotated protein [freshwater metagenome]|uniref:Unannotated protein n=1 Tax=freshwater metagenome TaxID=449393 RepID=A0A6J7ELP2_9ZZZZ
MLRRRNRLSSRQSQIVVGLAVVSGVLGALAGCHPTQTAGVDPVLTGLAAALVTWAGATSVWWVAGGAGAVIALAQPASWLLWVALAVCVVMSGVGATRESAAVTRSLCAAAIAQLALRLDLRSPFGLSAALAAVTMGAIVLSGLRRRSAETRRTARIIGLGALAFSGLSLLLLVIAGLAARGNITKGVQSAASGLRAMRAGNPEAASEDLAAGASALSGARSIVRSPLTWPAKLVPVLGQHVHSAERLVDAAQDTAQVVSRAIAGVDVKSVKVNAGVVDLTAIDRLQLPLETTRDAVVALNRVVQSSRSGWLVDPLGSRLRNLARETAKADLQARNAVEAAHLAPALLGQGTKRVWLVLFTTPAEARGLGGFPGNWAEITTQNGRITITRSGTVISLINGGDNKDGRIVHAPKDYLDRYGKYGAGEDGAPMNRMFWNNVTLSPDGPTVAEVAADLYLQSGGQQVDGVMVADPYALQAILTLTGPLTRAGTETTLTPTNIVPYLLIDQYRVYAGSTADRKDALQDVSNQAIQALLAKDLPSPVVIARAFGKPLASGHLMFWSLHPEDQEAIRALGISGTLPAPESDGFSYTLNNSGPNKLDTFASRSLTYEASVNERSGAVEATATITIKNTLTDPNTLPEDVSGNKRGAPKGSIRSLITAYSPLQVLSVEINGQRTAWSEETELGWRAYSGQVTVAPGEETVITIRLGGKVSVAAEYTWLTKPQPLSAPNNVRVLVRFRHGKRSISHSGPLEVTTHLTS